MAAKEGPTTVAITATTRVRQLSLGQLGDVKTGSCVDIRLGTPAPGTPAAAAKGVLVSAPAADGKCPEAASDKAVRGAVSAVNGNSISVQNAPAPVTVDQQTAYTKQAPASALVIAPGVCFSAAGPLDPGGVLQATAVTVEPPAANGMCAGT